MKELKNLKDPQKIRETFINFFVEKGHRVVPSSSLIPPADPSLLFTNSGMNQFKDIFLGLKAPSQTRICDSQKCMRLSGKHNDLEEVGVDTYHHTFFEMLGNWSFGDYYKKEAIAWAWELLTEVWGLPKDKLFATVHENDQEAFALWEQQTDLKQGHLMCFGDRDNFWEMGETGPCGPCSEIHIDMGEAHCTCGSAAKRSACGALGGGVNQNCARYLEIWNLVFIQYHRQADGTLKPLEKKHVDTGMGFERIVAVLQGKASNYDTPLFLPLMKKLETLAGKTYRATENAVAFRVIADHTRGIGFAIADGVVPSNEGRGYVIRRLIRRAYRYGQQLSPQLHQPFLYKLIPTLCEIMGAFFPELNENRPFIEETIRREEALFHHTLAKGTERFDKLLLQPIVQRKKEISGKAAFELYDTYGFPFDLTRLMAQEKGIAVSSEAFEAELKQQKARSKKEGRGEQAVDWNALVAAVQQKTHYLGETRAAAAGELLSIIVKGAPQVQLSAEQGAVLIFDQSVFYAEGGGQVGDSGSITTENEEEVFFEVEHTTKLEKVFLHHGTLKKGTMRVGRRYQQRHNAEKRRAIRRNHSATHLLQKALVNHLGEQVKQAGAQLTEQKLRFDFNHYQAVGATTLKKIEAEVNDQIQKNLPVTVEELELQAALQSGARAFFEEKYENLVRVVALGTYSRELCGGSHVQSTAEIGGFKITTETSSASGIRRIEAITGTALLSHFKHQETLLQEVMHQLRVGHSKQLVETVKKLKKEHTALKQEQERIATQALREQLLATRESYGKLQLYSGYFETPHFHFLRNEAEQLKKSGKQTVLFLAVVDRTKGKVNFIAGLSQGLEFNLEAGALVKRAAALCGGGGGGRKDFAQAGGRAIDKGPAAFKQILAELKSALPSANSRAS